MAIEQTYAVAVTLLAKDRGTIVVAMRANATASPLRIVCEDDVLHDFMVLNRVRRRPPDDAAIELATTVLRKAVRTR